MVLIASECGVSQEGPLSPSPFILVAGILQMMCINTLIMVVLLTPSIAMVHFLVLQYADDMINFAQG